MTANQKLTMQYKYLYGQITREAQIVYSIKVGQ